MRDEQSSRRSDLIPGPMIRLANGQNWTFPGPPEHLGQDSGNRDHPLGPDYLATLAMVAESEDETDRLRNELAFAICLLTRNYELSPGDVQDLLRFAPENPELPALQAAFHQLAMSHLRRLHGHDAPATAHPSASGLHRSPQPDPRAKSGKI